MSINDRLFNLECRMAIVEEEHHAPKTTQSTEMSDGELLAKVAELPKDWWPTWRQNGTGQQYRVTRIKDYLIMQTLGEFDKWYSHALDTHILAALCESFMQKKLRKQDVYAEAVGVTKFVAARYSEDDDWDYLTEHEPGDPDEPRWSYMTDAIDFPTHRHALLAAAEAVK